MNKFFLFTPEQLPKEAFIVYSWSSEREEFGINAAPTLTVTHDKEPSQVYEAMIFLLTIVVPTLTVIIPLIFWITRRTGSPLKLK